MKIDHSLLDCFIAGFGTLALGSAFAAIFIMIGVLPISGAFYFFAGLAGISATIQITSLILLLTLQTR